MWNNRIIQTGLMQIHMYKHSTNLLQEYQVYTVRKWHYCSLTQLCSLLCDPMDCSMPAFLILHCLLEFAQNHVHWVDSAIQPSHSLLFCLRLPSVFPIIRVFSNELAVCIRWPKYRSFSFKISRFNGYSGLIFFRIGWFDLLAVQGTLKSLLQHHSSKASILWSSVFFMIQLSHSYPPTGKTIVWLYRPLSTKCCLCFLIHCLGLS